MAAVRGEQYLTSKAQFESVYNKGGSWVSKAVVIKVLPNGLDLTRYGFTVSKRIGKAVVRNRVKRLLREILRQITLQPGYDIVFIARTSAAKADFSSLEKTVGDLLFQAGLLVGEYEGISSGAD